MYCGWLWMMNKRRDENGEKGIIFQCEMRRCFCFALVMRRCFCFALVVYVRATKALQLPTSHYSSSTASFPLHLNIITALPLSQTSRHPASGHPNHVWGSHVEPKRHR